MKMSNTKMGSIDFVMFSTIILLVSIGVIMVYSSSSYSALFNPATHDSTYYLKRQAINAVIGLILMFFTIKIDYHELKKYTVLFMLIAIILLLVVFAFPAVNGAKRWINLGFISLQPSELAKYMVVLFMAKSIERKGEKIKSLTIGILPYLIVSGLFALLVYKEKNLSIAVVIMVVTLIVLFIGGARFRHLFLLLGLVGGFGVAGIAFEPYRLTRFLSYLNPWADPKGSGYQLIQSLIALGSGGIWGLGLGKSRQKCFYIPEPYNDFIFAIIGEELGLIGCMFIIALFITLIWRGIIVSISSKDTYGSLLAAGITSVIAIQAIINIAVVTGSIPVTGVPLPFISYGGSSIVINLAAMGVLLNISRQY